MGYSPSGTDCSTVGPSFDTVHVRKNCRSCSVWSTVPARILLLCGFSMACSFLQGTSTSCDMGSSVGCAVNIFSDMVIHGQCGGNIVLFSTGCWGICSGAWSTSCPCCPPAILLHWPWCLQYCFSHISFLYSCLSQLMDNIFYPFLNMVSQKCHKLCFWVGSALASSGSVLEPAGTGCIGHRDNQGFFSQRPPAQSLCS